nr:hypothetical protein [Tanacetum cinerariifolium]
ARELKSTQDIADMLKVGYDNGNEIDMYVEHFGYDIMELAEEIIEDPFMPLRKMRADIRQKFMIDYRQALLDSNPGSTCRLDVDESVNGSATFKMIYIYFKRVNDGWLPGCRKVIDNCGWFLHLLHDDLSLNDGNEIAIISDSHKGLIDAVNDWLPEAEHRKCTRHIYANFKKKYNGLQY